jgi:two-component system sensor histidine kinase KdpD
MLSYMRQHGIAGPWPAGERIAVCVSAHPDPMRLVRAGRRLADQLDAPWTALHIETPAHSGLSAEERDRIAAAMSLAEYLGGEARTVPGTDLIAELRRFARDNNISQIVVGKRRKRRWLDLFRPSLVHELLRQTDSFAVHVVAPDPDGETTRRGSLRLDAPDFDWRAYALSTAAVAAAGFVAEAIEYVTSLEPDALSVVFLGAVLYSALRFGLFASVFASIASMLVYNFFFLPPFYTFTIADPQNLLALLIFLVVAFFTSNLASRMREQERSTRRAFRMTAALYDFSRNLASVQALDDLLWAVCHQVARSLGANVVIMLPEDGRLAIAAGYPPDDRMPESDWAAANWAWEKGEPAGRGSDTLPNSERQYFPMRTGRGMVAVLGVEIARGKGVLDPERRRMLEALLDQAAVAIERISLAAEASRAAAMSETEKFRTALLSSISHDLRTPLTSILGSVTALRRDPGRYDPRARDDLLATIQEEAERLERFVNNLLDITRLESGALEVRREWLAPAEVVDAAVRRVARRIGAGRIVRRVAAGLPLLRADFTLLETILVNLLDNALKHAAGASAIEVAVSAVGRDLVFAVTDDGLGIPREHLPRLFDKFFRVRRTDYTVAGTGLGLSICKGLVEAMGGAIEVESPAAAGRGARFTLRFPVEAQPAAAEAPAALGATEPGA